MPSRWSIEYIRSLPVATRRLIAGGILIIFTLILGTIWIATGFGLSKESGGLASVSEGAEGVASLIQEQTEEYAESKAELEKNLEQTFKSSALIPPAGLVNSDEEPDGVLYLGHQHRVNGLFTTVDEIDFFPSATSVAATLVNESDQPIIFDASRGSILVQHTPSGAELSYQPLFQSGTPTELQPGDSVQANIFFGPINGRLPFSLVLGDYLTDLDPQKAKNFSARFEIDPSKIIKNDD
jgi:hypothetical protein